MLGFGLASRDSSSAFEKPARGTPFSSVGVTDVDDSSDPNDDSNVNGGSSKGEPVADPGDARSGWLLLLRNDGDDVTSSASTGDVGLVGSSSNGASAGLCSEYSALLASEVGIVELVVALPPESVRASRSTSGGYVRSSLRRWCGLNPILDAFSRISSAIVGCRRRPPLAPTAGDFRVGVSDEAVAYGRTIGCGVVSASASGSSTGTRRTISFCGVCQAVNGEPAFMTDGEPTCATGGEFDCHAVVGEPFCTRTGARLL